MKTLTFLDETVCTIEKFFAGFCFSMMSIITLLGVGFRYILNHPLIWAEESSRCFMIWGIFIGISIATKRRAHLGIDIFVSFAPQRAKKALSVLSVLLLILTYIGMFVLSAEYVLSAFRTGNTSPILRIPYWIIYLAMPIGFFLSSIRGCQLLAEEIWKTGETVREEALL